jgi:rod shape-determining protein MreD
MIYVLWAVIIFLTFIVQGSISLFDVTPNLTVILACYAGIKKGEVKGMFIGSLIGIIEDSISGSFFGPHLLSKGLIGYLSSLIYSRFFIWTPLLGIISIAALTLTDSVMVFLSRSIFDKMPVHIGAAAFIIIVQSLLNAPLGLLLKPRSVK